MSLTFANIIDVLSKKANLHVKYLAVIPMEVDQEDNQEKNGAVVHLQLQLIARKLQFGNRVKKNRADWEKSIKEGRSALDCRATSGGGEEEQEEEEEEGGGEGGRGEEKEKKKEKEEEEEKKEKNKKEEEEEEEKEEEKKKNFRTLKVAPPSCVQLFTDKHGYVRQNMWAYL